MALAATGDPARFRDLFARAIRLTPGRVRARARTCSRCGCSAMAGPASPRLSSTPPALRATLTRR